MSTDLALLRRYNQAPIKYDHLADVKRYLETANLPDSIQAQSQSRQQRFRVKWDAAEVDAYGHVHVRGHIVIPIEHIHKLLGLLYNDPAQT